jgi:hypothetical protein
MSIEYFKNISIASTGPLQALAVGLSGFAGDWGACFINPGDRDLALIQLRENTQFMEIKLKAVCCKLEGIQKAFFNAEG